MLDLLRKTVPHDVSIAVICLFVGALIGAAVGNVFAELTSKRMLSRELEYAQSGHANYRLDENGELPSKISGGIRADCLTAWLKMCVPAGAFVGLVFGLVSPRRYHNDPSPNVQS